MSHSVIIIIHLQYHLLLVLNHLELQTIQFKLRIIQKALYRKKNTLNSNFSKFRCTGDENNIDAWSDRLCVLNNICYNVQIQRFEYFRRLRNPKLPLFYDSKRGMLTEFSNNKDGTGFLSLTSRGAHSWAPFIVDQSCPSTNVTWLSNLHTLWRGYFDDTNFGHLVWEDMGSISYSLDRMNEFDDQLMIMHANEVSKKF